ncbi:MAG: hypothetical protein IPP97_10215 [Candidatus Obscuribacter sp.]|nr:hypothetical protein [Candidatus Obscuribacter sp.]
MNTNTNSNTGSSSASIGTPIPGVVGWTFEDALDEAIEYRRDQRLYGSRKVSRTSAPAVDDFEAQTGWTREDAFAEAVEHRTDARLFGAHRHH